MSDMKSTKKRSVYVVLAVLLGSLGIHNFYSGRTLFGVLQLILCLVLAGITFVLALSGVDVFNLACFVWIWAVIEALTVKKDGAGKELA